MQDVSKEIDIGDPVILPGRQPDAVTADLQFRIFSVLWAIASLFHMAHSSVFDSQLNLALLTLTAFWVIFRPSLTAFVILIILQLFDAFFRMPFTTNHWIFTAFVNLTILQAIVFLVVKGGTFQIKEGALFKLFIPVVKIEVIILYFFAVFHKLNSGFFTPATSCATELLKAQHIDQLIPMNQALFAFNAYFTLVVEFSIPLLLCFTRTRNTAVLIGLFFHCVLSYSTYNAFYDFSALVFALYFLFLSPGFSVVLQRFFRNLTTVKDAATEKFSMRKLINVIIITILSLGIIYVLNKKLDNFHSVHLYFFWTIYSILFTGVLIRYMVLKRKVGVEENPAFSLAHMSFLIMPVVVFMNGTLPYLGLKTENSYSMFSNLRTEGGRTNHFIVPSKAQIFDYQKDVVEIISSTDPFLQQLADEQKALVLFEFRNHVNERKPGRIEYLLNGTKHVFLKAESGSFARVGKNPYILRKLMKFRPFAVEEPQECTH